MHSLLSNTSHVCQRLQYCLLAQDAAALAGKKLAPAELAEIGYSISSEATTQVC